MKATDTGSTPRLMAQGGAPGTLKEMLLETRCQDFWIDGKPTYPGRMHHGLRVEGLLMNARMVQAIFDDENPETRLLWAYPDTQEWDPDRNTDEFCEMLAAYHRCGLLAVTVGLQGGGPKYQPDIYSAYRASAFHPNGLFKEAWKQRLVRVLNAADATGMVVILNLFYGVQARFESETSVLRAARSVMEFLLDGGWQNIILDLKNEVLPGDGPMESQGIARVFKTLHGIRRDAKGLLLGSSTFPKHHLIGEQWIEWMDVWLPHGNDSNPEELKAEIEEIRMSRAFQSKPMPIVINEDSIHLENLHAALAAGVSWGYYDQGFGSDAYQGRFDWSKQPRESRYADLSGFQTPPINWHINTPHKVSFFDALALITGMRGR